MENSVFVCEVMEVLIYRRTPPGNKEEKQILSSVSFIQT